jgi:hypothetical protein
MDTIVELLKTGPNGTMADPTALAACIIECGDCARACTACADACLGEKMVAQLRRCIRLDLDCADACEATARMLGRQFEPEPELIRRQLEVLAFACRSCDAECSRHAAMHAHCRLCAEACRRCEQACAALLDAVRVH